MPPATREAAERAVSAGGGDIWSSSSIMTSTKNWGDDAIAVMMLRAECSGRPRFV